MKINLLLFSFMASTLACNCPADKLARANAHFSGAHPAAFPVLRFPHYLIDASLPQRYLLDSLTNGLQAQAKQFTLFTRVRPGQIFLNGQWLGPVALAELLPTVMPGDTRYLLIYGCEFGKGEKGRNAVAYLQKELGVAVTASDHVTGRDGD